MIKKFLIYGKNTILFSTRPPGELSSDEFKFIECAMPVEIYWEVQKNIDDHQYLIIMKDNPSELSTSLKKIFKLLSPYAILEKEREWLLNPK